MKKKKGKANGKDIKKRNSNKFQEIKLSDDNESLEKTERHQEQQLSFSQRKDRFLVVTTVLGVLIIILKYLVKICIGLIKKFPIKSVNLMKIDNLFISYEQIASILYVATIIIIIICFLYYCLYELYSFCNNKDNAWVEKEADRMYEMVFESAIALMVCNAIITLIAISFFSDVIIFAVITAIIITVLGIIVLVVSVKNKNSRKKMAVTKHYLSIFVAMLSALIILSIFLYCMFYLAVYSSTGTMVIYYENEEILLSYESLYYPKEIKCTVENEEGIIEKVYTFDSYGECAGVEKTYSDNYGKSADFSNSYYLYVYDIDISECCREGKNLIKLEFSIDNKEYCIYNTLRYYKEYDYTKKQMEVQL